MENRMEFPQTTKNSVAIWSSNPLLGKYPDKTIIWKDTCTSVFIYNIYNSQGMETTEMSINRWIDKEDMVYI